MSSSLHIDNKNKGMLILGEGQKQGSDDTTEETEQKKLKIKLTLKDQIENFACLHSNVFYLSMLQKYINSKQKILK